MFLLLSSKQLTTRAFQRYDHLRSLSELTREDPRSEEALDCREAETMRSGPNINVGDVLTLSLAQI